MWNKEYEIYGYHLYTEGKPVITGSQFSPALKATVVTMVIPAKEGGLIGSVAIVREPGSDYFLRARAIVNSKDDLHSATKARGRQIATDRLISLLKAEKTEVPDSIEIVLYEDLTDREKKIFEKRGKAGE